MTFDRILSFVEIILFIVIVVQGEYIRFYEREVHRIHSEREKERREWRDQKRKQSVKKSEKEIVSGLEKV